MDCKALDILEDGIDVLQESEDLKDIYMNTGRKYVLEYRDEIRGEVDCDYLLEKEEDLVEYFLEREI